jgi:hypothetical protein
MFPAPSAPPPTPPFLPLSAADTSPSADSPQNLSSATHPNPFSPPLAT